MLKWDNHPHGWLIDGKFESRNGDEVMADTEKITINMSVVDLGQVDLLVGEGFYSSRTDFIRTAIRNQLGQHSESVKQTITRKALTIGAMLYTRQELEQRQAAGTRLDIRVVGLLHLSDDITPDLAQAAVNSIEVYGVFQAPQAVKEALQDRIR
jgi:Arc/MetJ-type ribon-helix-helix transcriptional regulator